MNHGWTHANGIDPIPGLSSGGSFPFMYPWARRVGVNLALAVPSGAGNEEPVVGWDGTEGSTTPAYTTYFTANAGGLHINVHGVYTVTIETHWSGASGRCWFSLSDEIGVSTVIGDVFVNADGTAAAAWGPTRWPAGTDITLEVGQDSGSSQTLDDIYLELMMIGDYDGTERVDSALWDQ